MILIGVPKEIKNHEYRVGLTTDSVAQLISEGNEVVVETKAGEGAGFLDEDYIKVGAKISNSAEEIFKNADMIVKVKEPQESELPLLRKDQILYTYLHLAPDPEQTEGLIKSGCTAIAYETITDHNGRLPLLAPMSEVAGRLAVQAGAHFLEKKSGGRGILLGGPRLISNKMLKTMKRGSVIVDISIDQGGSCECSRPTTHADPIFVEEGVIMYCVANMPGAVPRTSAIALNNATLPFASMLAKHGIEALKNNKHLMDGLNVYQGKITNKPVAEALNLPFIDPCTLM